MDKKNTTIGLVLLVLAFISYYFSGQLTPPPDRPAREIGAPAPRSGSPMPADRVPERVGTPLETAISPVAVESLDQRFVTLQNDHIRVELTNFGAAIRRVSLLRYPSRLDREDPYVLNDPRFAPALGIIDYPGLDKDSGYEIASEDASSVTFRTVIDDELEVFRTYSLASSGGGDPYVVRHQTRFRYRGGSSYGVDRLLVNLGTASPVNPSDTGHYLNVGYYNGKSVDFIRRSKLEGGGFMSMFGFGRRGPIPYIQEQAPVVWASVKNQFFTTVLTPDEPGVGVIVRRVELPPFPGDNRPAVGVTGNAVFEVGPLGPGQSAELGMDFYAGPKEYRRLANFDHREDLVMQFGFFGFFSKMLLSIMTWVYNWMPNWGVAIIMTTLILRTAFLPLTLTAAKSSKRMGKVQPLLQEIREKYKDTPQKMQAETLRIFKQHRINPLGGCLPILVTLPFFFGFFTMLQSASELRFASFLWARDLSAPDTIARLFGFPVNLMPILMGVTSVFQMRLVPTPAVDNMQAKMFKLMPYIFVVFCYNFSCALALYWTVGNLFSIGQQLVINRMKDEPLPALEPEQKKADPAKKPKKKKKIDPSQLPLGALSARQRRRKRR